MLSATRAASTYPSQSRLLSAPQLTDGVGEDDGSAIGLHPTTATMNNATSAF